MNDATEQALARQYALAILSHLDFPHRSFGEGMVQYAIEHLSRRWGPELKASRAYTVSLTSAKDSLEQWRAYCPRSGGVALGFPMDHLQGAAADQGFLLAPCVYDDPTQRAIVDHIVRYHLQAWDQRRPLQAPREGISSHLVYAFLSDLDRFAPLLKHPSFAAEHEWRLISPLVQHLAHAEIIHVPSGTGIKLFRPFSLLTDRHPAIVTGSGLNTETGFHIVVGPNVDADGMTEAIRSLIPRDFGWQHSVGRTASPYR